MGCIWYINSIVTQTKNTQPTQLQNFSSQLQNKKSWISGWWNFTPHPCIHECLWQLINILGCFRTSMTFLPVVRLILKSLLTPSWTDEKKASSWVNPGDEAVILVIFPISILFQLCSHSVSYTEKKNNKISSALIQAVIVTCRTDI